MRPNCTILLLLLYAGSLFPQKTSNLLPNLTFKYGEAITYELSYGPITGGMTTATLTKVNFEEKELARAIIVAKTTGLADIIYRIKDEYQSIFDMETGLPVKSIRDVQEGSYKQYIEVRFNQDKYLLNSSLSGVHKVPQFTHDIASSLYYFRRFDFSKIKEGEVIEIQTYFGDDLFSLKMRYRGKERIRTVLGKIACLKFAPVTEVGRAFATEDDVLIWISDDINHVPIRAKVNLRVGSIKCDLVNYTNLLGEIRRLH